MFASTLLFYLIFSAVYFSFSAPAQATTLGHQNFQSSDQYEEILEPSSTQPKISPHENSEQKIKSILFDNSSTSGVQNSEVLDDQTLQKVNEALVHWATQTHTNQPTNLLNDLNSLEWVQQLAKAGYWLENNQWTDFRAIAIAGYLPNLRYWLGNDQWASFGGMSFSGDSNENVSNESPNRRDGYGSSSQMRSHSSSVSGYYRESSGSKKKSSKRLAPMNAVDLIVSMVKKMVRQPAFYLISLLGFGLLYWAFKKQAVT